MSRIPAMLSINPQILASDNTFNDSQHRIMSFQARPPKVQGDEVLKLPMKMIGNYPIYSLDYRYFNIDV